MPRLSCWFIRASLFYLVLGFTTGGLMLANKGLALNPALWALLPAHIELLFFGWIIQLAMGVAYWILPRFRNPPKRGSTLPVLLTLGLINLGLWLVPVSSWISAAEAADWVTLLGRALEALAVVFFALHAWPRIKASGV